MTELIAHALAEIVERVVEDNAPTVAALSMAEGILLDASIISGLDHTLLRSRTRIRRICRVRQAMMYVIRKRTNWSYPQIGRYVNVLDHTTVIHACKLVESLLDRDADLADLVGKLMEAEPIMPLQIDDALKSAGIILERTKPQPRSKPVKTVDSRGKTKTKFKFERPPEVALKKPEWTFEEIDGKRFKINSKGKTADEVEWEKMLVNGSRDLLTNIAYLLAGRTPPCAGAFA